MYISKEPVANFLEFVEETDPVRRICAGCAHAEAVQNGDYKSTSGARFSLFGCSLPLTETDWGEVAGLVNAKAAAKQICFVWRAIR